MARFTHEPQTNPSSVFVSGATQEFPLGAKVVTADGRAFRYVLAGAVDTAAGTVVDGPINVDNHDEVTVQAAAAAGATQISVTLGATAATANQYADGTISVVDVDGQGFTYSVLSHPAADASATLTLTLYADESVQVALTTSSQVTLIANQYNGVLIHATTEVAVPVGVSTRIITAAEFGWIQTRGVCAVLANATVAIGSAVSASDTTTAGGVEIGDGILPPVGYAAATLTATEFNPVFLTID